MTHPAKSFFPTLAALEKWASSNCTNCRYVSNLTPGVQPCEPCLVTSRCLSAWIRDLDIPTYAEDIIFGDRPLYARAQFVTAPSNCAKQKDKRGRPHS